MQAIYAEHLRTESAQDQLASLIEIVRGGRKVCLLCFEADAEGCHRSLVAAAIAKEVPIRIENLAGTGEED